MYQRRKSSQWIGCIIFSCTASTNNLSLTYQNFSTSPLFAFAAHRWTIAERVNFHKDEGEDNNSLSTILSLTSLGLLVYLELIPTVDPDYIFGALNNVTDAIRSLAVLPIESCGVIPLQKMGQVYHRAPFPLGPFSSTNAAQAIRTSNTNSLGSSLLPGLRSLSISILIRHSVSWPGDRCWL